MKKILVTGGAGFVGYHLASLLLKEGEAELTLVDNLQRGKLDSDLKNLIENPGVKFINCDLSDQSSLKDLGCGYDHVYHLAAVNGTRFFYEIPHEVLKTNTLTLINVLEWFSKNNRGGKLCFTSSNEAYAGGLNAFGTLPIPTPEKVPLVIEDPYNPRWSYASTKLIGELFVIHYAKFFDFRALIVRPHNFYGPRAGYDHVIPEFFTRVLDKTDPFQIRGDCNTRTFCYIEDAVRAMKMLMDSPQTDTQPIETVNIGGSDEIAIKNLAEKIFQIAGWRPKTLVTKDSPPGSVKRRLADVSKLKQLTGWRPETPLEEGLRKTFNWYLNNQRR